MPIGGAFGDNIIVHTHKPTVWIGVRLVHRYAVSIPDGNVLIDRYDHKYGPVFSTGGILKGMWDELQQDDVNMW